MYVSFLWHMHQPYYRNPVGGEYRMPWTFLHAGKDYYDMLRIAVQADARVTFNLVPSLIEQLLDYADPAVSDVFLDPLRTHPAELNREAKDDLLPRLFFTHLENQIRPLSRYFELHEKVRYHGRKAAEILSEQDFQDLEVLFLLAWCGEVVRTESDGVRALLAQGKQFTQQQKISLLAELHQVAGRTVEAYREAQHNGQIEISTTPYYHPILPLLLDMNSAHVAQPRAVLPVIQRGFGGDAAVHVEEACSAYRNHFGMHPSGFWPSEGSISAETLYLLAGQGIRWAASDEDVLAASLGHPLRDASRSELYRPHRVTGPEGKSIDVFFRDKALSDLIGFSYASWSADDAARDFVRRLLEIEKAHGADATVSVILDGENAWEFYPQNAAPFHRAMYRAIAEHPQLAFATFSERLHDSRPLGRVHAGSWIYASFSTWVGHPEKNRAWELLERTRCHLEDRQHALPDKERELAWRAIRIAEGSDWFWWLGDDHYSPIAGEFDSLFRLHLINVYALLGEEPPADLYAPIKGGVRQGLVRRPTGPVSPVLDGMISSYLEWLPAGFFDLGFDAGAMHRTDRKLQILRYGSDDEHLFLCVEGGTPKLSSDAGRALLEVEALGSQGLRVRLPLDGGEAEVVSGDLVAAQVGFAWGEVLELSLPLGALLPRRRGDIYLLFRLLQGDQVVERAPLYHMAKIELSGDYALEAWSA